MIMKTAIDEIIVASEFLTFIDFKNWFNEEKGRLKEKEKHQIIDAHSKGVYDCTSGKQYYNDTYETI